ncbi:ADP-ribosylglycohydrolase family protein [Kitasatospora kifunensis]|uniref:ADP-ribosylglycohydrolase n=1 Tax=Kitasatospora kifunensis TaxID=58351 RepID=A0A7W7QXU7_KITKI|nr:ADP-ribosylglycohydrolase family protein [Kitasatospora kifunensis]MBB4921529.1 ADP-ribosylglycohydrolase [Kitasatospora kifunensis]
MKQRSWQELTAYRARVRGCLLGGAVGDALGNPIEFLSLEAIRARYGESGVTGLVADGQGVIGRVTDDTQMTLFTADGWLGGYTRRRNKGIGGAETAMVRDAYLCWLETQTEPAPPPRQGLRHRTGWLREETWLYARRAPGNACLSGLHQTHTPDLSTPLDGRPGPVNPESKGCGTVMRSAPFGFTDLGAKAAFEMAAHCAQITHGHPTGYYAAGAFAALISHLIADESPAAAVLLTLDLLAGYPGHEETSTALRRAYDLATEGGEATAEKLQSLGGGWVAEEALAIGVYAALARTRAQTFYVNQEGTQCHPSPPRTPIEAAFLLSVNHSGDSDSTGSICGNLLGAQYGDVCLPLDWLRMIEGRAAIAKLADDFAAEVAPGEERRWKY